MDEFANTIRRQAAEALATLQAQEAATGADAIVELISCLLEDGAGGLQETASSVITTAQWMAWHRLVAEQPRAVTKALAQTLEQERLVLPTETAAMRSWAVQVLLATLDRMQSI